VQEVDDRPEEVEPVGQALHIEIKSKSDQVFTEQVQRDDPPVENEPAPQASQVFS